MTDILVVEDEPLTAKFLKKTLEQDGFRVTTILNDRDAVLFALHEIPDLIIVDIVLPGVEGYDVICQLRNHPKSLHIPIVVLSAFNDPLDKIEAYDRDVDGYITKPFHPAELLARVRRQLRRVQQSTLSPLTGLPGGLQVVQAINYKIANAEPWSILYLDLDNFKAFNDVYGFITGNEMILLLGRICRRVVYEFGNIADFVGHVGGDDFVVVTTPERAQTLCKHICSRFKSESERIYRQDECAYCAEQVIDHRNKPYQFPLVSLSIGVLNSQNWGLHTIQDVSYLAAEAKRNAKQATNNIYHLSYQRRSILPKSPAAPEPLTAERSTQSLSLSSLRLACSETLQHTHDDPLEAFEAFEKQAF